MSIPVSSGIGTGAAQVFNTNKSYSAMEGVLNRSAKLMEYKKRQEQQQAKEQAEKDKQSKIDYLSFIKDLDYNPSTLRAADVDMARQMVGEITKASEGKFQEINSGGEAALAHQKRMGQFKDFIGNSISSKEEELAFAKGTLPSDQYTDEQKTNIIKDLNTPGLVFEKDIAGKYPKKLKLPSLVDSMELFDKDVFYTPDSKVQTDRGTFYKSGSRLPDDKAKQIWKQGLLNGGTKGLDYVQSINNTFPDLDEEQKWDKAWAVFRDSKLAIPDNELVSTTPKDSQGGGNQYYDSKNWNIQKVKDEQGQEWTTIDKRTGGKIPLKNMSLTGVDGYPKDLLSGDIIAYRHDKDNKVIAKVSGTTFNEKNQKASLQEVEVYLPSTVWGTITNTISSNVGLKDLSNTLNPTNIAKEKGGTIKETNNVDWGKK